MTWHHGPLAAFDSETSGLNVDEDRIVTATVALIRPGGPVDVRSHLIAVDVDIPEAASNIHGITTEKARADGKPAADVLEMIAADLVSALTAGIPIVGMNVPFDLTILDRELRRNGLSTLEDRLGGPIAPVVDVLVVDKAVDPYRRGKRNLTALCDTYRVRIDGAHDAAFDALAAARVAWRIAETYPAVGGSTLADLHASQVRWRAEQTESFARYLRRELEQQRHRAAGMEPGSEPHAVLVQEIAELERRIDGLDASWPMRGWTS